MERFNVEVYPAMGGIHVTKQERDDLLRRWDGAVKAWRAWRLDLANDRCIIESFRAYCVAIIALPKGWRAPRAVSCGE